MYRHVIHPVVQPRKVDMKPIATIFVLGIASMAMWIGPAQASDPSHLRVDLVEISSTKRKGDVFMIHGKGTADQSDPYAIRVVFRGDSTKLERCIRRAPGAVTLRGLGKIAKTKRRFIFSTIDCSPHLRPIQVLLQTSSSTNAPIVTRTGTSAAWKQASGSQLFFEHTYSRATPPYLAANHFLRFKLSDFDSKKAVSIRLFSPTGEGVFETRCKNKALCLCPADEACTLDYRVRYDKTMQGRGSREFGVANPALRPQPGIYRLLVRYANGRTRELLLLVRLDAHDVIVN